MRAETALFHDINGGMTCLASTIRVKTARHRDENFIVISGNNNKKTECQYTMLAKILPPLVLVNNIKSRLITAVAPATDAAI